jgi:hypothetical protein
LFLKKLINFRLRFFEIKYFQKHIDFNNYNLFRKNYGVTYKIIKLKY